MAFFVGGGEQGGALDVGSARPAGCDSPRPHYGFLPDSIEMVTSH